jgi:hypothetical protein
MVPMLRTTKSETFEMTSSNDVVRTMIRNKLLGRWAAEKLGLTGEDVEAYSDALLRDTADPKRRDVFSKIRQDFDTAQVAQSDEQILRVMTDLTVRAGNLMPGTRGDSADAAAVAIARNLMPR